MAKAPTAQELKHRVTFASRGIVDDGYGNEVAGGWEDRFTVWTALRAGGGSEAVVAARLEGTQVLNAYVRSSAETRKITSEWRATLTYHGIARAYAITAPPDDLTLPGWIFMQIKSGVTA